MSDINSLVNSRLTKLSQENITQAREICSKADQCILDARAIGTQANELVLEAFNLYQESLKLYSRQAQPYIGLAYISYSARDLETAIGLLNKAYDIDPFNDQVNEMLALFIEERKQKHVSGAISKVAGKSLSEQLKTGKKPGVNIFAKISSIFIKSTKKTGNILVNSPLPPNNTGDKAELNPVKKGNFFENIRNLSPQKGK